MWAEIAMGRNRHGPILLWAEMTCNSPWPQLQKDSYTPENTMAYLFYA